MSMEKTCDLKVVESLIAENKMYALIATVDLTDTEKSLTLNVPGFSKSKSFTLSQSSDVILSILCREIPFVISDLLYTIDVPVFYKGFLVMLINGQLSLLEPTMTSLEADLRCLSSQVSNIKRVAFERLFWLKARSTLANFKRKSVWCPAKEAYRSYLKTLIDCKLCHHLLNCDANRIIKRSKILSQSSLQYREKRLLKNFVKFETPSVSNKVVTLSNELCYSSIFNIKCRPVDLLGRKRNVENSKSCISFLKFKEEEKLDIYCNEQKDFKNFNNTNFCNGKYSSVKISSPDESSNRLEESKNKNNVHSQNGKRRVAVRIIRDVMGFFWARPILSEAKLRELASSLLDATTYVPQPSLLGSLNDCQEYLLRLFVSISSQNATLLEISKSLNNDDLLETLPAQFRRALRETNKMTNDVCNESLENESSDQQKQSNGVNGIKKNEDNLLQNVKCINFEKMKTHVTYLFKIGINTTETKSEPGFFQ